MGLFDFESLQRVIQFIMKFEAGVKIFKATFLLLLIVSYSGASLLIKTSKH